MAKQYNEEERKEEAKKAFHRLIKMFGDRRVFARYLNIKYATFNYEYRKDGVLPMELALYIEKDPKIGMTKEELRPDVDNWEIQKALYDEKIKKWIKD